MIDVDTSNKYTLTYWGFDPSDDQKYFEYDMNVFEWLIGLSLDEKITLLKEYAQKYPDNTDLVLTPDEIDTFKDDEQQIDEFISDISTSDEFENMVKPDLEAEYKDEAYQAYLDSKGIEALEKELKYYHG